ncbi:hypothetical protein KAW18_17925 [candidate division WOR-3 bacterium]|nr:hypothetical protein [candidate division WOR-3 bacterium]
MINKPEPFGNWSRFIAEFSQAIARQARIDEYSNLHKDASDYVKAKRVLKALENREKEVKK